MVIIVISFPSAQNSPPKLLTAPLRLNLAVTIPTPPLLFPCKCSALWGTLKPHGAVDSAGLLFTSVDPLSEAEDGVEEDEDVNAVCKAGSVDVRVISMGGVFKAPSILSSTWLLLLIFSSLFTGTQKSTAAKARPASMMYWRRIRCIVVEGVGGVTCWRVVMRGVARVRTEGWG